MKKNNLNNFYVMDKCINNSDSDKFGHESIAKNIELLIENDTYTPPYNIALIGEWGLGKSSIIELISKKYEKSKKYKVIEINAWKYEKESLKKECFKKIYEEISETKVNYIQQLELILSKIFDKDKNHNKEKIKTRQIIIKFLKTYWIVFAFSFLISFIWQLSHFISNGNSLDMLFENNFPYLISRYFDYYFEKMLFTLGTPLLISFFQKNVEKDKNIFPLQIKYDNDYEALLTKMLEKKDMKFVIIIDDIDRLSTKKIVEALDTLKILMELDKCIFIVPFDDSILKSALNKNVISQIDCEEQVIKSEFILDKLFQFRFYVPPLIYSDMKDYTLKILSDEAKGLCNLIDKNVLEEIVKKIFMYDGVHTPRQIKKIINTFSNNILLFFDRVEKGKINKNFKNKTGMLIIAKISVLQSDFNEIYDKLFDEPDFCEKLILSNNTKYKNYIDIPNDLRKYYSKNMKIKDEYNKLINFLSRTSYIKSEDISIYLRCNEDKMSNIYGSSFNRELLSYMQSMNFPAMNNLLQENTSVDIDNLIIEYMENEPVYNLPMIVMSIFNMNNLNLNNDKLCETIAYTISNAYKSEENFEYKNVNLTNLLKIKRKKDTDKYIIKMVDDYIIFLLENIEDSSINHAKNFEIINENFESLNNTNIQNAKKYLYKLCISDDNNVDLLDTFKISNEHLTLFYGEELYNGLIENIDEYVGSDSYECRSNMIFKLYTSLKDSKNKIDLNNKLINLLDTTNHLELLKTIISNNKDRLNTVDEKILFIKSLNWVKKS